MGKVLSRMDILAWYVDEKLDTVYDWTKVDSSLKLSPLYGREFTFLLSVEYMILILAFGIAIKVWHNMKQINDDT